MLTLTLALLTAQLCPPGQETGPDTAGRCCWPQQVWSNSQARCLGIPRCAPGFRTEGEQCVPSCPEGQSQSADTAGHCCWPGQAWAASRSTCVGVPTCPATFIASGESCVPAASEWSQPSTPPVVAPIVAAPPPPPMVAAPVVAAPPPPAPEPPRREPLPAQREVTPEEPPPVSRPVATRAPRTAEVKQAEDDIPVRGVVNPYLFSAFDFSELTQGLTAGMEINFVRGTGGSFGMTLGVGFLTCAVSSCSKVFLHFPLALKGGVRLGKVVELNARIGAAPAFIWRGGSSQPALVKFLIGAGLFFQTGRGGVFVNFDLLPNNGVAHVISLGWLI